MKKVLMVMLVVMVMLIPVLCLGSDHVEQSAEEEKTLMAENKQKQKSTMGDLVCIGKAIESYIATHKAAPQADSIKELKNALEPVYIKQMPLADGWGNDLFYKVYAEDQGKYWVASGGSDGQLEWDGKSTNFFPVTSIKDFVHDIVLSNGRFLCGPKIK